MAFDEDLSSYQGNFGLVASMDGLKRLIDHLYNSPKPFAYDIETGYLGPDTPKLSLDMFSSRQFTVGFSLTNDVSWGRYVPLFHDFSEQNLDPEVVWPLMKPLLEEKEVVCHNWGFESRNARMLDVKGHGPKIVMPWSKAHDSMIQSYVLSETPLHGLKELSKSRYNYDQATIDTLFDKPLTDKQKKAVRFNPLPLSPKTINYACDDVVWSLRLDKDGRTQILREREFIYQLEREICEILVDMSETGISVDWEGISTGLSEFQFFYQRMEDRTRLLFEEATGKDLTKLNFRSVPQMRQLLFEEMELNPARMTKPNKEGKQSPSTDETSLEILRKQHPAVDQLVRYRQSKKMGEWFETWNGLNSAFDERIHPSLNQVRVQSGRFASDSPNVQNITKKWWFNIQQRDFTSFPKGKEGDSAFEKHVRENGTNGIDYWAGNARDYLIASPGYRLLTFDYKTAEMRILAGLAKEPYLLDAFEKKQDVHATAASLAFGVPLSEVTPDHRQRAKAVNFGLVYGQGVQGLADGLGIPKSEAQKIMDQYFAAFSKVDQWFSDVKKLSARLGYVESFMGRKSTLWDLQSSNKAIRSKADRMAVNIPVQGGAADYCKVAMVRSKRSLIEKGWWQTKVRLLMNQHDSLVFEVHESLDLREVVDLLEPQVSFPIEGFPLMEVDWECGVRWGSVKPFVPEDSSESMPSPSPPSPSSEIDFDLAEELVVHFDENPTEDDIRSVIAVLKRFPGTTPVVFSIAGAETVSKGRVSSDVSPHLLPTHVFYRSLEGAKS